jgi:pimeloyl-ACP methyl ester carboxylesterase
MMERPDARSVVEQIRVSTLVLVGDEDVLTAPDESRRIAQATPNAELTILPGAGHVSNVECPDLFNDALRTFLARV